MGIPKIKNIYRYYSMSNHTNNNEKIKVEKILQNIESLSKGNLPSNAEVSSTIDNLQQNEDYLSTKNQMSSSGQRVLDKVEDVLQVAKDTMNSKNRDDHIQQAVLHAKNATDQVDVDKNLLEEVIPKNEISTVSVNIVDTCNKIVDLGKTFVTSSDFRYVVKDFVSMAKEIVDYNMPFDTNKIDNIKSELENKIPEIKLYNEDEDNDPRTIVHKTVDVVADLVDTAVPTSVQDQIGFQVKKVSSGKTSVIDTLKETSDLFYSKVQALSIPEDKKYEYLERFKADIKIIQSHPDYQQAISDLTILFDSLIGGSQKAIDHIQEKISVAINTNSADSEAQQAIFHIKSLLENFANGNSLDPIIKDLQTFANNISNDSELRKYFDHCKIFMQQTIIDPEFINDHLFTERVHYIIDYGKNIVTDRYQSSMKTLLDNFTIFLNGFGLDLMNSKLKMKVVALGQEVFLDDSGKPLFKPELIKDLTMLIPLIADQLAYLPIPRIETEDNDMHVILDNIIIKSSNIFPKYIKVGASSIVDSSEITNPKVNSTIRFTISRIQASGNNISYFLKKKSGLIKVSDSGIADFSVYGNGLSLDLEVAIDVVDQSFKVNVCNVNIDKLSLKIHDSKHDVLYKILRPLIEKIAKSQFAEKVERKLTSTILKIN